MRRHFFAHGLAVLLWNNIIKVFCLFCTLTWRVNSCVSRQEKGMNTNNKGTKTCFSCTAVTNQSLNSVSLVLKRSTSWFLCPNFNHKWNIVNSVFKAAQLFLLWMVLLVNMVNKKKSAAFNRDSQDKHLGNNLPRDSNVRRVKEGYHSGLRGNWRKSE